MSMTAPGNEASEAIRFGNAQLVPAERRLVVDGGDVGVGARAFDVLLALIERRDRVVTRSELLDLIWPEADVNLNNIDVQISSLRKFLGPQIVATIPGRGFRFTARISDQANAARTMATSVAPLAGDAEIVRRRTNLPRQLPQLIGRADDVAMVGELIEAYRVVTIVGAGGVGKTRLAERLLSDRRATYGHGVCWIELASLVDGSAIPAACAAALGINVAGGEPGASLAAALAPLEILICLDNAEHLAADVGRLVEAIVAATESVRILVTSQVPLHLPQERVVRLGALAVPSNDVGADEALGYGAVDLFVQRARAADARFELDNGNAAAVVDLCHHLDGMPLAIEIAAARSPLFGVRRILESLDHRLEVLKGGYPSAPARQQTVLAALEWSHHLLGPDEQVVFRRLAIVAGSASLELIQSIVADAEHGVAPGAAVAGGALDRWAVVDALAALIDRSLVAIVADEQDPDRPRYRLLESPRAYALDRLVAAGEVALLEERHARAMAVVLTDAWADRWSGRTGFVQWMDRVDADRDNARVAFGWALRQKSLDLVLAMAPILMTRSWFGTTHDARASIAESIEQWLATQPPDPSQLGARLQLMRFWEHRQVARSLLAGKGALSLAMASGDRFAAYFIEASSVRNHLELRDIDAAAAALARADALEDPDWPATRLLAGAEARSVFHYVQHPPKAALEPARRALQLAGLAGHDRHMLAGNLVTLELMAGDPVSAAVNARELLDDMVDSRNEYARVNVRLTLLSALLVNGDLDQAKPVARAAWRPARYYELHGDCADQLALMCALDQRWSAAAMLGGYADAVYARRGVHRWPAAAHAHGRTASLLSAALDSVTVEQLALAGSRLPDEAVAQVAFDTDIVWSADLS